MSITCSEVSSMIKKSKIQKLRSELDDNKGRYADPDGSMNSMAVAAWAYDLLEAQRIEMLAFLERAFDDASVSE